MKFFFADDSSQKAVREGMGKIIGFGGIFVDAEVLGQLEQEINHICSSYSLPDDEEIKWSPRRDSWIYNNLHGEDRTRCYTDILEAARNSGCKILVVAWDTGRTTLTGQDAFQKVLDFAFERIEMYLAKQDSLGVIVADRPGGSHREDEQFLASFLNRITIGTVYVHSEHIPINILTTPSHLQRHLQLADLTISITCAMISGKTRYAEPLFSIIKEMLIENHVGYRGGTGLKLFPDELINLYHWLLDEEEFVRVSASSGIRLPDPHLPYATI